MTGDERVRWWEPEPRVSVRDEAGNVHAPDGHTGRCCAYCTRTGSTPTSHLTVPWPCPTARRHLGGALD